MKTKHIVVRVTEAFKERVRKIAGRDNKSMSDYVSDLIRADLKKREKL